MKKYITTATLLFILTITYSHAQNFIGVKGGISIPSLSASGSENNPINSGYSSRIGPDFAAFFEAGLSEKFSFTSQLEYSSQGGKKNGLQAFPLPEAYVQFFPPNEAPTYLYANYKSEAKLNYLMLSELAKINFNLGSCSVYFEAGPFGAYLLSAHDVTSGSSKIYADEQQQEPLTSEDQSFDSNQDIKDQLHKGNFGVEGNFGIAFNLANGKIFVEGGGNYGFVNIQKGSENGKNNIGAATVRIGYAISLGN